MANNELYVASQQYFWIRYYEGSNQNGGPWFAGITVSAAPDWNEGNLLSVNILERNDKAITACLADWRGETGCLVKDTNQYQAQMESDYKMGNFESDYKCCRSNCFKISHSDLMEYSKVNVELLTVMLCVFDLGLHFSISIMSTDSLLLT